MAITSPKFPSLESVKIHLISSGLTNGPIRVVDEDRGDLEVQDISHLAMASFPRTPAWGCGAPTIGVKLPLPDCVVVTGGPTKVLTHEH